MRNFISFLIILLLATAPAMATVTIRAQQNSPTNSLGQYTTTGRACNILDVNYTCDAGERVRSFALEITLDNDFYFSGIQDFKRGESNETSPGYGIFPGKFREEIDPEEVNWLDPEYNPVAPSTDRDAAGTGLGTNKVIIELGSLYVGDANRPLSSGTMCRLTIDPNRICPPADCNIIFTVNTNRKGVVLEDSNLVTPTLEARGVVAVNKFSFPKAFPCWEPCKTHYNEWIKVWEPNCWLGQCANPPWPYQCKGDADNKTQDLVGKYRVYLSDYNKMKAAWAKRATQLRFGDGNLMCADFDHVSQDLVGKYRVYVSEYSILVSNWGKKDTQMGPKCPVCP